MTDNNNEFYLELILKSLGNAKQFNSDAKLLSENNSFGHAYALAVLGFEELAKAWGIFYLHLGIHEKDDELIEKLFSNHVIKHYVGLQAFSLLVLHLWDDFILSTKYKEEYENIKILDANDKHQKEEFEKQLMNFVHDKSKDEDKEISETAKQYHRLKKILDDFSNDNNLINDKKLLGLYVDADLDTHIIEGPDFFTKENIGFIDTVEGFLNLSEHILKGYVDNSNKPEFMQYREFSIKIMEKVRELDDENNS
ncbi:MAG TPA: AbiV family abortive infection protein [Candidatus Bathyarchaeia archaeon]|nr:AbiV family abortive infection protein [Candidatus Bathyarchaeia archaeon]